ncbi:carbohydrate esterase, putative [Actinidia rufa]|uniref:Carbohydrate esterase, putative n=1 Tax=Actinidia rufa TaxID=165716 RepID=A0A7J0DHD1_9ERIC|nr:carbohydrate esterase, putative [Actinidia rufa]
MLRFLWLLLLVYACLVSPASSQPKNIFLLAGQSNMSGRGGVTNVTWDGIVPPQCQPSPTILRLSEELAWVEATEPLHKDIDVYATCGVGPGLAFANSILANDSSLGPLVRRASAALQGGGTIRALLWYQGESDTINSEDAELYQDRLDNFFIDLRVDLPIPSLPIIQVALASGLGPFIEKVRAAQLGLNLDKVTCVDAKGLELEPDHLHLSTGAEVRLGEMLANEFLRTLPRPLTSNAHKRFHNFVGDLFNKPPV